ncbi:MAG: type IVB secretion system protein IcmG/DotF [Legionellaceae bacterium]|nr:type IVB secretion system protein IcmG/DotF [Legionellaceae bacterium]
MSDDNKEQYTDEEYHFAIEPEGSESAEQISHEESPGSESSGKSSFNKESIAKFFEENRPARNALVAVGVLIVLVVMYQFTMSLMNKNKASSARKSMNTTQQTKTQPTKVVSASFVEQTPTESTQTMQDKQISKKLAVMEQNQSSMKSQFMAMNSQTAGLNSNLNILLEKMSVLSQQVSELSSTVEEQSRMIVTLKQRVHTKRKMERPPVQSKPKYHLKYNVQAVIPGRAWLIGSNGSTLTVRKGTMIPGYGMVKIIDTMQGRVLTSSGQIIKFGQEDS